MPIYFTPGPAQIYPTVQNHLQEAMRLNIFSISHRSPQYVQIHQGVWQKLQQMYNIPENYTMFLAGSATQHMERVIQNTVEKTSFHFVNGSFSRRFFEIARDLGKTPQKIQVPLGQGFDFDTVKIPSDAELITFTAVETSTGVQIWPEDIYKIAKQNPETLIAVDTVSTIPLYDLDMSKIDIMIFSVQKGLGLPAGLGVAVVSDRALKKAKSMLKKGLSLGSFGAWPLIEQKAREFQTLETPNVLGLFLLDSVLADMHRIEIKNIRNEANEKEKLIEKTITKHPNFDFYVKNPYQRAQSVVVVEYERPQEVLNFMKNSDYILGGGYGEDKHKQFRIANFPAISLQETKKMLDLLATFKS